MADDIKIGLDVEIDEQKIRRANASLDTLKSNLGGVENEVKRLDASGSRLSNAMREVDVSFEKAAANGVRDLRNELAKTGESFDDAGRAAGRFGDKVQASTSSSLRADIGGIGDVETAGRAIGGGLGALGFTQADRAIAVASELPATIEAVGQLKQAIGKDMKLAFDALKNSIGGAGIGLIGATVALGVAYALASSATAKRTAEITTEIQEKQKIFALEATQTRAQILDRLNQLAIERDIAVQQRERAAGAVENAREEAANQNIFLRNAIKLGDQLNISDSSVEALRDELERTTAEANRLTIEHSNLTEALSSEAVAINTLNENAKQANREREEELRAINENTIAKQQAHITTQALAEEEERLHQTRKRDFNRQGDARRGAETEARLQRLGALRDQIAKTEEASAERIAQIAERLQNRISDIASAAATQKAETISGAEDARNEAARKGSQSRIEIEETLQETLSRIQRQFGNTEIDARQNRNTVAFDQAKRGAIAAEADAQDTRRKGIRDVERNIAERIRLIDKGEVKKLRIISERAKQQITLATRAANIARNQEVQRANSIITLRHQAIAAELNITRQGVTAIVRTMQDIFSRAIGDLNRAANSSSKSSKKRGGKSIKKSSAFDAASIARMRSGITSRSF